MIVDKTKKQHPILLVITGAAATGKSTLGKNIATTKGWVYIDKDTCTKELIDYYVGEETRESDKYKEIQSLEYKCALTVAKENLNIGNSVVLILPMINQIDDYHKWQDMTKEFQFKNIKFVWMIHNANEEHKRMKIRNDKRDAWKLKNWSEYEKNLNQLTIDRRYHALKLDICESQNKLEKQISKFVNEKKTSCNKLKKE